MLFETLLGTGQRGSDVIKMMRQHYRRGAISVKQMKTDIRVWITGLDDFTEVLEPWLTTHHHEPFFPVGKDHDPISGSYMRKLMRSAITMAGLPDTCTLHGLRYTFAIRAIETGLDHQIIESIVGTLEMAFKYTEKRRKARLTVTTLNTALKQDRELRLQPARRNQDREFEPG